MCNFWATVFWIGLRSDKAPKKGPNFYYMIISNKLKSRFLRFCGLPQYFEPAYPPSSWRPTSFRWSCSRWRRALPWWKDERRADCFRTHPLPDFRTWWGQVVAAGHAITWKKWKKKIRQIIMFSSLSTYFNVLRYLLSAYHSEHT